MEDVIEKECDEVIEKDCDREIAKHLPARWCGRMPIGRARLSLEVAGNLTDLRNERHDSASEEPSEIP